MTQAQEQRARWLETLKTHGLVSVHPTNNRYYALPGTVDDLLTICATITAEAIAAEQSRVAEGAGITERDAWAVCDKVFFHLNDGDNGAAIEFIRALIAEATARERERCARWQPIETAPRDGTKILLARIVGHPSHPTALWWAASGFWSAKWQNWNDGIEPCGFADPTHWMPLPDGPSAAARRAGEGEK